MLLSGTVWLTGLFSLQVTTTTPDALCPPLDEAREAVRARVGEVKESYEAEFALIRGESGSALLRLVLRDAEQRIVLERDIPVGQAGCQDAAQAIALVIERYFEALQKAPSSEAGTVPSTRADSDASETPTPGPGRGTPARADRPELDRAESARPELDESGDTPRWRARAGISYDRDLGLAPVLGLEHHPSWLELGRGLGFGFVVDAGYFLAPLREHVRDEEVSAWTLQSSFTVPFVIEREPWAAALGPSVYLRVQRADGGSLSQGSSAYRLLQAYALRGQVQRSLSGALAVAVEGVVGFQWRDATKRFVLSRETGSEVPVLEPSATLVQGQVLLSFEL